MTHDPFQTYAMLGAYSGVPTLQPFTGQQNYGPYAGGLNPLAQFNPLAQQLQLASILAAQTNPQWQGISPFHTGNIGGFQGGIPYGGFQLHPLAALQNPLLATLQNPLIAASLQNPLNAGLQNPVLQHLLAQTMHQSPYQQSGFGATPFGQTGSPFGQTGYPLAPQSWIGQGQTGQINPLYQQLAARAMTQGINPWAGY